jgi:hypothetical protein
MCEVGVDAPVAVFVGIRQGAPGNLAAKARVVQLRPHGVQTRLDVAQTLAVGQLREGHAKELIATRESAHSTVAVVATDAAIEFVPWQKFHQLSKNDFAGVHRPFLSTQWWTQDDRKTSPSRSRARSFVDVAPYWTNSFDNFVLS